MDSERSDRGRTNQTSERRAGRPSYNGSSLSPESGQGNSRERRAARRALERQQTDQSVVGEVQDSKDAEEASAMGSERESTQSEGRKSWADMVDDEAAEMEAASHTSESDDHDFSGQEYNRAELSEIIRAERGPVKGSSASGDNYGSSPNEAESASLRLKANDKLREIRLKNMKKKIETESKYDDVRIRKACRRRQNDEFDFQALPFKLLVPLCVIVLTAVVVTYRST